MVCAQGSALPLNMCCLSRSFAPFEPASPLPPASSSGFTAGWFRQSLAPAPPTPRPRLTVS
eukprot:scaffold16705_cov74-Isochrysis_galbana.AAC.2